MRSQLVIEGEGRLADAPEGTSAVLRVVPVENRRSLTGQTTWGSIANPRMHRAFADLLAWTAAEGRWLDVMPLREAERRIKQNDSGAEFTLKPDERTLRRHAETLDVASYLTAEIRHARVQYRFFWSWAEVDYSLACHRAADGEVLWRVDVRHTAPYLSDREACAASLREAFRWLEKNAHDARE